MDEAKGITLKQALVGAVTFPLDCCLLDVASESDKRHGGKIEAVLFCALWAVFVYSGLNLYQHLTSFVADLMIY